MHHSPGMYSLFFRLHLLTIHGLSPSLFRLAVHRPGLLFRLSSLMYRTGYAMSVYMQAIKLSTKVHAVFGYMQR
jgi:hypothetical protein